MKFIFFKGPMYLLSLLILAYSQVAYSSEIIPNQYIIVLKDQKTQGQAQASIVQTDETVSEVAERLINDAKQNQLLIQNKNGVRANAITNRLDKVYKYALKGFSARLTPEALVLLRSQAEVDYIAPDKIVEMHAIQAPTPSWGLDRIDQRNLPLDEGYEYFTDGSGVHVYIIDTGIRASHNEFSGRVANGYDFVDNDADPVDCNGHGTHVAGTVGGYNYGVAKNTIIHPVRIFDCSGGSPWSRVIASIDWIIDNLNLPAVVNMSLGGGAYAPVDAAVNNLINSGATVVVSAGNSNNDACNQSPARVPNALTIASSTMLDERSFFSNTGACVDIFAPGSAIISAWWNSDTATRTRQGTSMSAPHVTGVVALYLEENPTATVEQVTSAIINGSTTNKISNAGSAPNRLLYNKITSVPPLPPEFKLAWLIPVISLILQ